MATNTTYARCFSSCWQLFEQSTKYSN